MKILVLLSLCHLLSSVAFADTPWENTKIHDIFASGHKIVMTVIVDEGIYMPPKLTLSRLSYTNGGCWLDYIEASDRRRELKVNREVHFSRFNRMGNLEADNDKSIRELETWRNTENMTFKQLKESCVNKQTPLVKLEVRPIDELFIEEAQLRPDADTVL